MSPEDTLELEIAPEREGVSEGGREGRESGDMPLVLSGC